MDTKLKNISRHRATKFIAFLIAALLIAIIFVQIFYINAKRLNIETIVIDQYSESSTFRGEVRDAFDRVNWALMEDDQSHLEDINFIFAAGLGEDNISLSNNANYSREDFEKYDQAFFAYENGQLSYGENTNENMITGYDASPNVTMYIAFTDEYLEMQEKNWDTQRQDLIVMGIRLIISIIIALALIIYLMIVTGRKPMSDELHSNWLDRIYTEILLLFFIPFGVPWTIGVSYLAFIPINHNGDLPSNYMFGIGLIGVTSAITAVLYGILLLALVRKIKDGRFIKGFILYKFFNKSIEFFKSFFDGSRFSKFPLTKSLHQRQVIFIVASFLMVLFTFVFIWGPFVLLFPLFEIVIIYWYIKYNNETYEEINKGFDESLEEQMKSERMKLELITNVSHDLKTPLTSIISYVDLLSKEEELSDSAKDYVSILADKSDRLKNIVSDLFDLAKSTSGDINLELETLDMKKLIEQTIGDMEDDIEKTGQEIKTNFTEEPLSIYTDGKKMYRVFQNVIDNALKYSLKGTRIFVELKGKNGRGIATIKNTSNYEMDFTPDDILQRFSRGDKSRTTDGSGLGLSIAESFTRVCGGNFKIDIDGDMFKVIISFDLV